MAGNQRRDRTASEKKVRKGKTPKISLAEALGAIQQNTVPVLPSLEQSSRTRVTPAAPGYPEYSEGTSGIDLAATSGAPDAGSSQASEPPAIDRDQTHSIAMASLVLPDIIADSISEKATYGPAGQGQNTALVSAREPRQPAMLQPQTEAPAIFIRGARKLPRYHSPRVVPQRAASRPMAVQFIVAMLSVIALFSILTAVSPLGKNFASLGYVEAYANSVPWVPTATPSPTPKPAPAYDIPAGASLGTQAVINQIASVFGAYAQGALDVASCESGYNPGAYNPYAIGNSHAEGVFQILYPSTWDTTPYANDSPYDADANIDAAYQIFSRDGYSWEEWACQP